MKINPIYSLIMAWDSEIKDATYTSPSGKEFVFQYGALSKTVDLKTATFTFPEKDGALVVPLGIGGQTFPMTCYFSGSDCFQQVAEFEAGLLEKGYGELQHPVYGVHKVVPTGSIKRSDDLVNGLNVTQLDVTFAETITDESVTSGAAVGADSINESLSQLEAVSAEEFVQGLSLSTVAETLDVQAILGEELTMVTDCLTGICQSYDATTQYIASVREQFDSLSASLDGMIADGTSIFDTFQQLCEEISSNIAYIATRTMDVAHQFFNLVNLPSRVFTDVASRIEGYAGLVNSIISQFANNPFGINSLRNQYVCTRAVITAAVASVSSGVALLASGITVNPARYNSARNASLNGGSSGGSSRSGGSGGSSSGGGRATGRSSGSTGGGSGISSIARPVSREDVVNAAVQLIKLYDSTVAYMDSKITYLDSRVVEGAIQDTVVDTGESFSAMRDVVVMSVKLLIDQSFSLETRKIIRLGRDRQLLELLAELYGNFDRMDEFIVDNHLTLDEIQLIPMGREVAYYV